MSVYEISRFMAIRFHLEVTANVIFKGKKQNLVISHVCVISNAWCLSHWSSWWRENITDKKNWLTWRKPTKSNVLVGNLFAIMTYIFWLWWNSSLSIGHNIPCKRVPVVLFFLINSFKYKHIQKQNLPRRTLFVFISKLKKNSVSMIIITTNRNSKVNRSN